MVEIFFDFALGQGVEEDVTGPAQSGNFEKTICCGTICAGFDTVFHYVGQDVQEEICWKAV